MKKYSLPVITLLLVLLAIVFGVLTISPFANEPYQQSNLFKYYLLTPKPLKEAPRIAPHWYFTNQTVEGSGVQVSTLTFTDIQQSEIHSMRDKLENYIEGYPDRRATMNVDVEEHNGKFELRITYYDADE